MENEMRQSQDRESCEVLCQKCHEKAATISFANSGRPAIVIEGFLGTSTAFEVRANVVTKQLFDWIQVAAMFNPRALHDLDPDLFGFICSSCKKSYCNKCWHNIRPVFDEDWPVWLDEFRGTCPEGHSQMLQD